MCTINDNESTDATTICSAVSNFHSASCVTPPRALDVFVTLSIKYSVFEPFEDNAA